MKKFWTSLSRISNKSQYLLQLQRIYAYVWLIKNRIFMKTPGIPCMSVLPGYLLAMCILNSFLFVDFP
jgi:uncharacterized membrane protein YhdT